MKAVFRLKKQRDSDNGLAGIELTERMRMSRRRQNYWLTVVVLTVIGGIIMVLAPGRRRVLSTLPKPELPPPDYQILWVKETPTEGQERLTVGVLVKPGLNSESLRLVLDWVLFSLLDDYNRVKRRNARVIWAYLYEDANAGLANWRAMAVWVDPKLPRKHWPTAARIGGDAIKKGAVEYDFTNPILKDKKEVKGK